MIREHLNTGKGEPGFRWRGGEVSRLEAMTDAVFAIALTLLVVSLEVPATWAALRAGFVQLPVFLVCFALLYYIWYSHYIFHRRFGLEDRITTWLNGVLIFLVLFYVYPLKFLAQALYTSILFGGPYQLDPNGQPIVDPTSGAKEEYLVSISGEHMSSLMMVYSGGFLAIFLLLLFCTVHAWRKRETLELTEMERMLTKATMREQGIMVGFAGLSLIIVTLTPFSALSGLIYILVGPVQGFNGYMISRAAKKISEKIAA